MSRTSRHTRCIAPTPPTACARFERGLGPQPSITSLSHARATLSACWKTSAGAFPEEPSPKDDAAALHAMRPLAGDMLVEGRRPLDGFVRDLLERPYYRLVVRGGKTDAIVTPADLNKLPVRVYAYALLAHLEATMLEAIKRRCDPEDAIERLPEGGAVQIRNDYSRLAHRWLNPSLLTMTSFKQKGEILGSLGIFQPVGSASISDEFEGVYDRLRNPLMHSGTRERLAGEAQGFRFGLGVGRSAGTASGRKRLTSHSPVAASASSSS